MMSRKAFLDRVADHIQAPGLLALLDQLRHELEEIGVELPFAVGAEDLLGSRTSSPNLSVQSSIPLSRAFSRTARSRRLRTRRETPTMPVARMASRMTQ